MSLDTDLKTGAAQCLLDRVDEVVMWDRIPGFAQNTGKCLRAGIDEDSNGIDMLFDSADCERNRMADRAAFDMYHCGVRKHRDSQCLAAISQSIHQRFHATDRNPPFTGFVANEVIKEATILQQ